MAFDPMELGFIRILRGLDRAQILSFLDACNPVEVPPNAVIVEEGEEDDAMLFLLEGELEVYVGKPPDTTSLRFVRRGEALGELALLGLATRRTASIRSTESCDLLILERAGYEKLAAAGHPAIDRLEDQVLHMLADRIRETDGRIGQLAEGSDIEKAEPEGLWNRLTTAVAGTGPRGRAPKATDVLAQSAHFKDLPANLRELLAGHLEVVGMDQGERIIEEGSMKGDAWILATGEVGVYRATKNELHEKVGVLHPGALFGHLAIIADDSRTATCVTEQGSWLYRMPREVCKALVVSTTPEGRALRRSFIHALAWQMAQANQRLAEVTAAHAARTAARTLGAAEIEKVKAATMAVVGAE
ncbi:cyclic nucleotide-binding domain-containing protein [Myxococcota bacterium]|nr:cyclic nucleotide-binding domain-containing protein [Myxococcota bacterium]